MPPSAAVLYKHSPRPVHMETLNLKPSVEDVEVDAQLRDEFMHESPRAGVPEPRHMNSRHAGTLSSGFEGLFLIHVVGERCGDPAAKPPSVDLFGVQRQGKKTIGCGEGDMDAILMTVSSSISSYFFSDSSVLCRLAFSQLQSRLSPSKVTIRFHSTCAIRPSHYPSTCHLYLSNPSAHPTARRSTGRTSSFEEVHHTCLLRPLSESTHRGSSVWCSVLPSSSFPHNHRPDSYRRSPGTADRCTNMRTYSGRPDRPGPSKPCCPSLFSCSSWASSTSSYPSTKPSPPAYSASFLHSLSHALSSRRCGAHASTGHITT